MDNDKFIIQIICDRNRKPKKWKSKAKEIINLILLSSCGMSIITIAYIFQDCFKSDSLEILNNAIQEKLDNEHEKQT